MKANSKPTDAEAVSAYMAALKHPLKAEVEKLREIIRASSPLIAERIKWNAPSYYYKKDLLTFNLRAEKHVHIVFHDISIVSIPSAILHGEYKDRRMAYFKNMEEVLENEKELARIVKESVEAMELIS